MNKSDKVILRHNRLKKLIKDNDYYDKRKLYNAYKSDIEKKINEGKNIKLVDYQTICNDLKYLKVEHDDDTDKLCLPSQIQINNYRKILGHTLKLNNFKISLPIEILSNNTGLHNNSKDNKNSDNSNKNMNGNSSNIELHTLYKIIIFHDDNNSDIINSLIYKCFSNINILGTTIGFRCLELYFIDLETANNFTSEIKKIYTEIFNKKSKR